MRLNTITTIILISALSESFRVYGSKPRVRTLLSEDPLIVPLFLRKNDETLSFDVTATYKVNQLYHLLTSGGHIGKYDRLMFGGKPLEQYDPELPLSDIGIGAESVLTINTFDFLVPFLNLYDRSSDSSEFRLKYLSPESPNQIDRSRPYSQLDLCTTFDDACKCDDHSKLMTEVVLLELDTIDLQPLLFFTQLRSIMLMDGKFDEIDWRPLKSSACLELSHLWITDTQIRSLDLSPLNDCKSLQVLRIEGNNQLQNVVLPTVNSLVQLKISDNHFLESIDLKPLWDCTVLRDMNFVHNRLKSLIFPESQNWRSLRIIAVWDNILLPTLNLKSSSSWPALRHIFHSAQTRVDLSRELRRRMIDNMAHFGRYSYLDFRPLEA